jgi:hypothetical protein
MAQTVRDHELLRLIDSNTVLRLQLLFRLPLKPGTTSSPPSILANNPLALTGVAGVIGDVAVHVVVVVVAVKVMGGKTGVEAAVNAGRQNWFDQMWKSFVSYSLYHDDSFSI